ncbi:hypothetical protein TrVE_jg3505 [Triparma verrucosa]|uniref:Uncharacterized protein n=1 Tax=Triparma verrucosa TaxID=1606542 RepID=A0A9W7B496_9STRA|nr:hypothetical protein TrVE_jg3505 [Triparma verrucosa]
MLGSKVALVTGATSGIGRATALMLAREGARVVATGRNSSALTSLVSEIEQDGGTAFGIKGDCTNDTDVERVVSGAVDKFGSLSILINNAGVLRGGAVGTGDSATQMETWDFNMAVNARAPMAFIAHAVPHLKENESSAIVNVSSVNGLQSFGGTAGYCASKASMDMLMRCASVDLAPFGIRCNNVNPGVVVTNLQKRGGLDDEAYEKFLERSKNVTHPLSLSLGRVAVADEVASSILFLADCQRSGYVTGTSLKVDGGRSNLGAR